jgi:hypothetical protein
MTDEQYLAYLDKRIEEQYELMINCKQNCYAALLIERARFVLIKLNISIRCEGVQHRSDWKFKLGKDGNEDL